MKHILVFGMTENPGGVESFLMTYLRKLNRNALHFDFLCNERGTIAYQDELTESGAKFICVTARSENFGAYRRDMRAFFSEHARDYDAIWVNICSLANIDYLVYAKKYGIERRIIHSHNSQNMDSKLRGLLHRLGRARLPRYATDFWACSDDAARWFYNPSLQSRVEIIRNAIDVQRFAFSPEGRARIRAALGCGDDCCIVGNVGRLHFQKNQMFALEIFRHFLEKHPGSKLVLVGQGEDEVKLKARAGALGIEQSVIFAGVQRNVPEWLSAMDLYLFPSIFEGLGIAALEAQANGLPVLASSDVIPAEVGICDHYQTCALNKPPEVWADRLDTMRRTMNRIDGAALKRRFSEKGYDIDVEAAKLERLLLGQR